MYRLLHLSARIREASFGRWWQLTGKKKQQVFKVQKIRDYRMFHPNWDIFIATPSPSKKGSLKKSKGQQKCVRAGCSGRLLYFVDIAGQFAHTSWQQLIHHTQSLCIKLNKILAWQEEVRNEGPNLSKAVLTIESRYEINIWFLLRIYPLVGWPHSI